MEQPEPTNPNIPAAPLMPSRRPLWPIVTVILLLLLIVIAIVWQLTKAQSNGIIPSNSTAQVNQSSSVNSSMSSTSSTTVSSSVTTNDSWSTYQHTANSDNCSAWVNFSVSAPSQAQQVTSLCTGYTLNLDNSTGVAIWVGSANGVTAATLQDHLLEIGKVEPTTDYQLQATTIGSYPGYYSVTTSHSTYGGQQKEFYFIAGDNLVRLSTDVSTTDTNLAIMKQIAASIKF